MKQASVVVQRNGSECEIVAGAHKGKTADVMSLRGIGLKVPARGRFTLTVIRAPKSGKHHIEPCGGPCIGLVGKSACGPGQQFCWLPMSMHDAGRVTVRVTAHKEKR